jgi:hypothetical protein
MECHSVLQRFAEYILTFVVAISTNADIFTVYFIFVFLFKIFNLNKNKKNEIENEAKLYEKVFFNFLLIIN